MKINNKPEAISKSPERCSALPTSMKILIKSRNPKQGSPGRSRRGWGGGERGRERERWI